MCDVDFVSKWVKIRVPMILRRLSSFDWGRRASFVLRPQTTNILQYNIICETRGSPLIDAGIQDTHHGMPSR